MLPSAPTADGYRAVAFAHQVTEKKAGTFPLEGAPIVAVFRHAGQLWVIDNACAHEDGPVGEGDVEGKCVRCPYHDWEYDFTTGACRTDPERSLATFSVRERDGVIWVGPRLTEGTKARGGDHNDGLETITR
ncbi:MAG: Rieske (2Fe-2S) protein [Pseudomonadota bacterium]|nr:Rieske (2Fe-2S) protein [Pseudomonadota bacterium]